MKNEMTSLPRWAERFLRTICPEELYEVIEGDIIQKYNRDVKRDGERKAAGKLYFNVIRFLRPGIILRRKFSVEVNALYMIRNYFTIAYRHLLRSRVFSLINIAGLSVGIMAFFLIIQYVSFELSYDRFYANTDEIYRVAYQQYEHGELKNTSARSYPGLRSLLKDNFPEIKAYTSFGKIPANTGFLFKSEGKIFNEAGGFINADTAFFHVFSSLLIRGNPDKVLLDKNNIILSESMATKIFGSKDPIGQRIERIDDHDEGDDYIVAGIFSDLPANAHLHANFVSFIENDWPDLPYWENPMIYTYITVKQPADPVAIATRLNHAIQKIEKENPQIKGSHFFLQPVAAIHLQSQLNDEFESNGSQTRVYMLLAIGMVILVIAWINYINIETARFTTRAREIGVRRVIGSGKRDLLMQFFVQFMCVTVLAFAVAVAGLWLVLPHFHYLTGIPIARFQLFTPAIWFGAIIIFFIGSCFTSLYPSLFLIRLNPVSALKSNIGRAGKSKMTRQYLVIAQFTVSLVLIAFLLVIDDQLEYMRISNRKIDLDQVITVRNPMAYSGQEIVNKHGDYKTLENILLQNPAITMMSTSSAVPGAEIGFTYVDEIKRNIGDPYDPTRYKTLFVGTNYIPLYGLKVLAGRNFEPLNVSERWIAPWEDKNWTTIMLNESAVKSLGFASPQEAVGQEVYFNRFDETEKFRIIGVVEDYHHEAIKKEVYPTIFSSNYDAFQQVYYSIRLRPGTDLQDAIAYIEKSWKTIFPDRPFEYFFLEEYYDQQFKSELYFSRIFSIFSGVALFIACLGILGISLFEAHIRSREISIRKVFGATMVNLLSLLSRGYVYMVIIAFFVAMPVTYFLASHWLAEYPVHIALHAGIFIIPAAILFAMMIAAISFQMIKSVRANPADTLKYE